MLPQASRSSRLRRRLDARFGTSAEAFAAGVTSNVSSRGLSIVAKKVYAAGSRLQIELTFPGDRVSRIGGIVCWSIKGIATLDMPGSMGVRLDAVDDGFFRFLADEVESSRRKHAADFPPGVAGSRPAPLPSSVGPLSGLRPAAPKKAEPAHAWKPSARIPAPTPEGLTAKLVSTKRPVLPLTAAEREDAERAFAAAELKMFAPQEWWKEPAVEAAEPREARPIVQRVPRFREQLTVRFGPTRGLEFQGSTQDISRTGLSIACPSSPPPGDRVRFAMTLADGQICHGSGSVAWTRLVKIDGSDGAVMGVRIERIQPSYRDLIDSLSRRH